jgi:hypothetical protein
MFCPSFGKNVVLESICLRPRLGKSVVFESICLPKFWQKRRSRVDLLRPSCASADFQDFLKFGLGTGDLAASRQIPVRFIENLNEF